MTMPVPKTLLALAALASTSPGLAQALASETTDGAQRVCTYQTAGIQPLPGKGGKSLLVPLGEPCPPRYREPARAAGQVPEGARLTQVRIADGKLVCVYSRDGKLYERAASAAGACAPTP